MPHVGPWFTGLKGSQSTIWFRQGKSGFCVWDVGSRTQLCSCENTIGQLAVCIQELLQRTKFPFQFSANSGAATLPQGLSDTAGSEL